MNSPRIVQHNCATSSNNKLWHNWDRLRHKKGFIIQSLLLQLVLLDIISDHIRQPPLINLVEAHFKRCFTCRSRGSLGDCRDPFTLNSTTYDTHSSSKPSIEATPCASGWCAKIIEDDFGDSIAATERSCMTRPPTDNEERCSETIFENHRDRKVFLCMCYGDLCNSATGRFFGGGSGWWVTLAPALLVMGLTAMLQAGGDWCR